MTTLLFEELAQIINHNTESVRKYGGIKLKNPQSQEIYYTLSEGEATLRDKLANLEKFIHTEEELDPLIKLAIVHYHFRAIYLFSIS